MHRVLLVRELQDLLPLMLFKQTVKTVPIDLVVLTMLPKKLALQRQKSHTGTTRKLIPTCGSW